MDAHHSPLCEWDVGCSCGGKLSWSGSSAAKLLVFPSLNERAHEGSMPGGVVKQRGRWKGLWYEDGVKKSKVLGSCSEMTKTQAREAVAEIVKRIKKDVSGPMTFGTFVEGPYFDFYGRKWKRSSSENTKQRIRTHLVAAFKDRDIGSFKRDDLQELLDQKGPKLSFSVVDHLRWDMRQIFQMAIAEGHIRLNPAALLFTPKEAKRPKHRTMTVNQIRTAFEVLAIRERVISKLAILSGMRPGEIFGLKWGRISGAAAEVTQRIYRGVVDSPKTHHSVRDAALTNGLVVDLDEWRSMCPKVGTDDFVFSSERGTALSKDNVWRRNMQPNLETAGLGWCNFQVMRRTHATLMRQLKVDPKAVADQLGHTLDVSLNVYTQSPVEDRVPLVNQLEQLVIK
jgi:integrase